ncbi:MAG: CBS domain-containing protein [Chloroflexi bacterium]|nr:CBS domain-containing protein [Chloroflexota bacterium]
MGQVSDILRSKGRVVWSISPEASVYEALQLMAEKNVGALMVLDGGRLVGIFSERDYARKVILKGRSSLDTPVEAIMTRQVFAVRPEDALEACMALMTDKRARHLPVFEDSRLVGVVSIGDVVRQLLSEQELTITQLESYILSKG